MVQQDKELLLKDLCVRLPYGVMCDLDIGHLLPLQRIFVDRLDGILLDFYEDGKHYQVYLSEVKPYLRPMSSMTKEEKKEFDRFGSLEYSPQFEIQIADIESQKSKDMIRYLLSFTIRTKKSLKLKEIFSGMLLKYILKMMSM